MRVMPNSISQVKGMKSPPAAVKLVMEAVCIIKNIKATRRKDAQSGKMVDDFWESSIKMMSDSNFLDSLRTFDKDNIPPAIITRLRTCALRSRFWESVTACH